MTSTQTRRHFVIGLFSFLTVVAALASQAHAGAIQNKLINGYTEQAKILPGWTGDFSAERGRTFFTNRHASGKPDTPACTSCHGNSPQDIGQTRAGKTIEPMALSRTADRYTDAKKVEKWFLRNCNSVLGRECTPLEKGDFLTFMVGE